MTAFAGKSEWDLFLDQLYYHNARYGVSQIRRTSKFKVCFPRTQLLSTVNFALSAPSMHISVVYIANFSINNSQQLAFFAWQVRVFNTTTKFNTAVVTFPKLLPCQACACFLEVGVWKPINTLQYSLSASRNKVYNPIFNNSFMTCASGLVRRWTLPRLHDVTDVVTRVQPWASLPSAYEWRNWKTSR